MALHFSSDLLLVFYKKTDRIVIYFSKEIRSFLFNSTNQVRKTFFEMQMENRVDYTIFSRTKNNFELKWRQCDVRVKRTKKPIHYYRVFLIGIIKAISISFPNKFGSFYRIRWNWTERQVFPCFTEKRRSSKNDTKNKVEAQNEHSGSREPAISRNDRRNGETPCSTE